MNATFAVYPKIFPIQSYLSNADGAQGLLTQARGNNIVAADRQVDVKGSFIGLSPNSQTPVAFRPLHVDKRVAGQIITLIPGQVMRLDINGFEWGIPFGWLGGGLATLIVADNDQPFINWPQQKTEVLIHRTRLQVAADGSPVFVAALPNRFPWPSAQKATNQAQAGQPIIAIEPTRVSFRLRVNNLAAPSDMRVLMKASDDLDIGTDGLTPGTADLTYVDVTFPQAVAGVVSVGFPVIEIVGVPARLGGDLATVALVDISGGALAGAFVDILRYGKI